MNTNSDDILLLKLIKQGDQIAFRHLFYQYADSLERFITYYIHDREKSQDLVLDIFTYIWENRQNFEIKLTLKAYLFQAARNKSFTYIRDKKIPVYLEEMEGMEIVQNYDSELELQELHHLIEEAVSLLPDKCREIFRKSREENLTNKGNSRTAPYLGEDGGGANHDCFKENQNSFGRFLFLFVVKTGWATVPES